MTILARPLLLALLFAFSVQAAIEAPDALIERISGQVLDIVARDKEIQRGDRQRIQELVREKILPHVDFERMTALASGHFWRDATPEQQRRLTEEFRDLLVHVYSGAIAQAADTEILVKPLRGAPTSGEVEVHSEVIQRRGAEPVELNYRLAREPSGWKIYDISVLGAWLVQSYRASFANEIRRSGIDGLIGKLSERNDDLATRGGTASTSSASGP